MRIHSIATPVNFGYNKALNEKTNKKLEQAKGNKDLANTLLEMNRLCMSTEDKLRQAEKANNIRMMDMYTDLLMNIKPITTEKLNQRFPLLKYRETELADYQKEVEERKLKDGFHWLNEIAEELMDDEEFEKSIVSKYDARNEESDILPTETPKTDSTTKPKKSGSTPSEYLEEFVPNEYSPKGFSSLGGMEKLKELLTDKIILPIQDPELAKLDEVEYGKKAPRGILLFGPPGCGKTAITQALAVESGVPMYNLKISKAGSSYVNGSAINIQKAYEHVADIAAKTGKPVILFMDEMESVGSKRKGTESNGEDNKVVATLLPILEEARGKNVVIIGATNCFDQLDEALKSRLEEQVYIGLPDSETRESVLKLLLNKRTKGQPLASNPEELKKVVDMTNGFSNRDLTILTDKAALAARGDNRRDILAKDYIEPVLKNEFIKVKETNYQAKSNRPSIGYKARTS